MQAAVAQGKYDSRTRVLISRRICRMFQLQSLSQSPHSDLQHLPPATEDPTSTEDSFTEHCSNQESSNTTGNSSSSDSKLQVEQENFQRALLNNLSSPPAPPSPKPTSALSVASYFSKPEGSADDSSKQEGSLSAPAFRTEVQPHQVASAVNSFRALKIGIAAASGGALMFCAGGLAAPSIVTTLAASLTGMTSAGTTSAMMVSRAKG
mmetsp:Transcript_28157/g.47617  ORF Transcript_28157/g.47617 Transcript_28157/m.47617 type:complete len:208 (+) Transcript_28157:495-1118(+)